MVIQERDRHLLRELSILRIIDRDQAKAVGGFGSVSRTNRRLRALTEAGLLKRFFLGTRVAGQKAIYSLSPKGALLVEVPYRGLQRRKDEALVSDFGVQHQLALSDVFCDVKYRSTLPKGVTVEGWEVFYQPLTPSSRLIPDGYFFLRTNGCRIAIFLEVDFGHERRAVWKEKVQAYFELAVSAEYERRFGHKQFRVLVITTTDRRVESLRKTAGATTNKIFWFTTLDAVRTHGLCAVIWRRVNGATAEPLLEETQP